MYWVALTNRLAITEKPPTTTKRAPWAAIALTATSSSGSAMPIGSLNRRRELRALGGKVLATPQQRADGSVRRKGKRSPLFGVERTHSDSLPGARRGAFFA